MINLIKKYNNRKLARQEFEQPKQLINLNFNAELNIRLEYKKQLLFNQLMELTNSNPLSAVDITSIYNLINIQKQRGYIDEFYNIIKQ